MDKVEARRGSSPPVRGTQRQVPRRCRRNDTGRGFPWPKARPFCPKGTGKLADVVPRYQQAEHARFNSLCQTARRQHRHGSGVERMSDERVGLNVSVASVPRSL
jgi:hypothetical protein